MQNIRLVSMNLTHFKGIRSLDIKFGEETNIFGRNGSGKSTIVDAILWLFFGKDSSDRKDFEIKTLDENNKAYSKLSHEVKAVLEVDGQEITLKRVYREKWTKKRGQAIEEFTGHETEYFWNEVPYNEREYSAKLFELINEQQFKLLTNLRYFNESLKWQDRRSLIMQLAGGQTDLELASELNDQGQYDHLIKALMQKKTLEDYRKEIVSKKNKIREENKSLPDRIDEARRSIPPAADYVAIEQQILALNESLQSVESMILSQSAAEKEHQNYITDLIKQKGELSRQLVQLEFESLETVRNEKRNREAAIADMKNDIRSKEDDKSRLLADYSRISKSNDQLQARAKVVESDVIKTRESWVVENDREFRFDPSSCTCPTCKQQLPDVDATATEINLKNNFNAEKSKKLEAISAKGQQLKTELESLQAEIKINGVELGNIKAKGETMAAEIDNLKRQLSVLEEDNNRRSADEMEAAKEAFQSNPTAASIREQIGSLDVDINTPASGGDKSELLQRRRDLTAEIDALKAQHAKRDLTEQLNERIAELMRQESESAITIAELEGFEFSILEYDKQKMALVEQKINNKFQLVSFKLFDQQINGGTSPTCVTLINGVPYPDANTASKINASLDIIRVFSHYFGVKAPVFIDNRESVTELIPNDLQIINLIVSPQDARLRVSSEALEKAFA